MSKLERLLTYALVAILVIIFVAFIPTIKKGQQLNKLQELSNVWNDCETKQLQAQAEAKQLREELGLTQASQPQAVVRTGTQVQQLTGSIIE